MNKKLRVKAVLVDKNDEVWAWDGQRVFHVLAEFEGMAPDNGYPAYTELEAEGILYQHGYLGNCNG